MGIDQPANSAPLVPAIVAGIGQDVDGDPMKGVLLMVVLEGEKALLRRWRLFGDEI